MWADVLRSLAALLPLQLAGADDGQGWCDGGAPSYEGVLPGEGLAASLVLALATAADVRSGLVRGCVNPESANFDIEAALDDGSCAAVVTGCTDPSAINYVRPAWAPLRVCLLCPARAA